MQSTYEEVFRRQGIPFFIYLILSSGLLFNHDGGADMAFMFVMIIFLLIHHIVVIFMVSRKKWGNKDLISILAIGFIYLVTSKLYLTLMWEITSWVKK
jgi:hypothetical protein